MKGNERGIDQKHFATVSIFFGVCAALGIWAGHAHDSKIIHGLKANHAGDLRICSDTIGYHIERNHELEKIIAGDSQYGPVVSIQPRAIAESELPKPWEGQ